MLTTKGLDYRFLRDRCKLAPLTETPVGSAEVSTSWTPGLTVYRCLLKRTPGREVSTGAQVAVADAMLYLEKTAAPTLSDHVVMTQIHGETLSPAEEWEVVGKPVKEPSGWVLNLRYYTGGKR